MAGTSKHRQKEEKKGRMETTRLENGACNVEMVRRRVVGGRRGGCGGDCVCDAKWVTTQGGSRLGASSSNRPSQRRDGDEGEGRGREGTKEAERRYRNGREETRQRGYLMMQSRVSLAVRGWTGAGGALSTGSRDFGLVGRGGWDASGVGRGEATWRGRPGGRATGPRDGRQGERKGKKENVDTAKGEWRGEGAAVWRREDGGGGRDEVAGGRRSRRRMTTAGLGVGVEV